MRFLTAFTRDPDDSTPGERLFVAALLVLGFVVIGIDWR